MKKQSFLQKVGLTLLGIWLFSQTVSMSYAAQLMPGERLSLADVNAACVSDAALKQASVISSDALYISPLSITITKPPQPLILAQKSLSPKQPTPTQKISTPTPTPQAVLAVAQISPTIMPQTAQTNSEQTPGLNADVLFSLVNQYRASYGMPAFEKNDTVCSIAEERAPQVAAEVASGNMHAGFYSLHLPYQATENIISMRTDQEAFNWWVGDPIHRKAILSSATYSCVACSDNSCSEIFTGFSGN